MDFSGATLTMEDDEEAILKARRERMEMILYHSIEKNDVVALQKVIDEGYDPNSVFEGFDAMGRPLCWYPLHLCCEKGRDECAKVLFRGGADPDVWDRWCMTPLMYAVEREWHNMVELMLASGAKVDTQDTKGRTPLHLAVECSDTKCIEILCKANASVNYVDVKGRIPLYIAVSKDGRVDHVKEILAFSSVNISDERDKRIPLQVAIVSADKDRLEYVRLLLSAGSDTNHRDEANLNSMLNLMYICKRRARGVTADDLAIATALIDGGYKLNEVGPRTRWHKFGGTAIKMAAEHGMTEFVRLFLSRGANPDKEDDCCVTPILTAAFNNNLSCVAALIEANCQLNPIGELKINHAYCQVTPLAVAIQKGHFEIARILVQCGAPIRTERNLIGGANVSQFLINDCEFWQWLVEQASNPLSLFDACIKHIRDSIGTIPVQKLECIPLPAYLKRCVLLEDLLENL